MTQRHAQDGFNGTQNTYFLQVQAGGAIATISGQNDKRMEILSLTTAEEIEQAQTRLPPSPEMHQPQAPQPAATPSPSPIQPQPPSQPHNHGGRSHSASGVAGHADEPQRAAAQSHNGHAGDFATQEHAALAQQQIIDQHARLAAERAATQREEEEREQRHAPHSAIAHAQAGQTNPWDETVAGRYINRYMDAAERGNEAEMLKLSEAYAETPKFKEWEAWGEDKLQQLAIEQQQQQQQMQHEQHARVLSR
ncbi:MAG: hypothetical protein Q4G62_09740 [Pseudomonadota bacterium]|nr:hypothetical protein [Pseudomonadota bacterium]